MGSESSESAGDNGQADPVNGYWYWDRSSGQTHPLVFVGSWWYSNLTMSCMFSVQSSRMKASSGTSIGNGSRLAERLFFWGWTSTTSSSNMTWNPHLPRWVDPEMHSPSCETYVMSLRGVQTQSPSFASLSTPCTYMIYFLLDIRRDTFM